MREQGMLTATRVTSIFHGMINHPQTPFGQTAQAPPQSPEDQQAQMQVGAMIHKLSLSIYERAVAQQMIGELDEDAMQQLARASVTAAQMYFVGVGAISKPSNEGER